MCVGARELEVVMSRCEGQFDDADGLPDAVTADLRSTPAGVAHGQHERETDSEEEWDLYGEDDDDICADFEEEKRDFTKKLNAIRGAGGLATGQMSQKGSTEKAPLMSKSLQVRVHSVYLGLSKIDCIWDLTTSTAI